MTLDFRKGRLLAIDHLRFGRVWLAFGGFLIGLVVVASLISLPTTVSSIMLHDKILHLCAYATLMAWFGQLFRNDLTRLLLGIGFVVLGVCVEYLQGMVPDRQFDRLDMVANASGVLLAWALSYTRLGELLPAFERLLVRPFQRA